MPDLEEEEEEESEDDTIEEVDQPYAWQFIIL
jgi:hypothetical protein